MRRLAFSAALSLTLASFGCGHGAIGKPVTPEVKGFGAATRAATVSDGDFGSHAQTVLSSGSRTLDRRELLAGVVNRQLARAERRFHLGSPEAGMAALTGAMLLLRAGEGSPVAFAGQSQALSDGVEEAARGGDEGQALALYQALDQSLPKGAAKAEVENHLAALQRWLAAVEQQDGPLQAGGVKQQTAVHRALMDSNPEVLQKAHQSVLEWIHNAMRLDMAEFQITDQNQREEAVQAYKAVRAGAATLVGLYLRNGNAAGALSALEQGNLRRIVPAGLAERLEHASEGDAQAWADLFGMFDQAGNERSELTVDIELSRAASWGAAVELHRLKPTSLRHTFPLAEQLLTFGMAEVSPRLIRTALGSHPPAENLSLSLALILRGVISESDLGDIDAARRTFEAAEPILAAAEKHAERGLVRPSPARVAYVMGAIETQFGDLNRAHALLQRALLQDPKNSDALRILAAIERQRGATPAALANLAQLAQLCSAHQDTGCVGDALVSRFEVFRDQRDGSAAGSALGTALQATIAARNATHSGADLARAERLLSRVLELYGRPEDARRASERAWDASRSDPSQIAATVLDASRRALLACDLRSSRQAVQRALEAQLEEDDLVYTTLWLRQVEKSLHEQSDGTVESAFSSMPGKARWPAALRNWATGKLDAQGLKSAAQTPAEHTEAAFYITLDTHGLTASAELTQIAKSSTIELLEVSIARDVVNPKIPLIMPSNVALP